MNPRTATVYFVATLLAVVGIAAAAPNASADDRPRYTCLRAGQAPMLDGRLDETCWTRAEVAQIAHDVAEHNPGRRDVRFRLSWNARHLYFAAEVEDSTPCSTHTDRDDPVWDEDCFELYLNPEGHAARYYEIDVNALGAIWDSLWIQHRDGRMQTLKAWTAPSLQCAVMPSTESTARSATALS